MKLPVIKIVVVGSLALIAGTSSLVAYRFVRADVSAEIYRERLGEMRDAYAELTGQYNRAVRKTAVTELIVEDGAVRVRVRTMEGVEREIDTTLDPSREIYADYVILDGRLWIRRVFDSSMAPDDGVVIDPAVAEIDWDASSAKVGKAVYRRLAEGRWVITVTGDGSLGLGPASRSPSLTGAPEVGEFETIVDETDARVERVGLGDALRHALGLD